MWESYCETVNVRESISPNAQSRTLGSKSPVIVLRPVKPHSLILEIKQVKEGNSKASGDCNGLY